ncbi:MAG: hypothetical protein HYU66_22150 [Armatimonadetes bacterium]|nr:hypothetical protein [Armatimonadota bacterium]
MRGGLSPARGVAGTVGVALAVLALPHLWWPPGWGLAMAAVLLLTAAALEPAWPGVWRWLAAMLTACFLLWFRHLNYAWLLRRPPAVLLPWVVGIAFLLVFTVRSAGGAWVGVARARLRGWRGWLLAGLWVYASARWFTRAEWRGGQQDVFRGLYPLLTLPLGVLALIAAAKAVPQEWMRAAESRWRRALERDERLAALLVGLCAVVAAGLLAYRCIGPLPHVEDEIAYLYQAKTIMAGGFRQAAPPVPGAFDASFAWVFPDDGGWSYGIFPPGWPLLLAGGVALGCAWLVGPVLCGVALALLWRLVRAADGPATAGWCALLLHTSPFFLLQGASFFAHTATLVWILLAMGGAVRLARLRPLLPPGEGGGEGDPGGPAADPHPVALPGGEGVGGGSGYRDALLTGLGVGMCLATRYVEGLLLGVALAGYLASRRVVWRSWVVALLAVLPGLGLALADNQAKTGSPFRTPVERWYTLHVGAPVNRPGFGPDRGVEWDHHLGPGHSLWEGLWNTNANAYELQRYGLGCAGGSLLLALLFVVYGRKSAEDRLQLGYALLIVGIYVAYWYHGIAFGPRFLHPLLVPLCLFTVKGARLACDWLGGEAARPRLMAFAGCGVVTAWLAFMPLELQTTYHDHRGRPRSGHGPGGGGRAAVRGDPAPGAAARRRDRAGLRRGLLAQSGRLPRRRAGGARAGPGRAEQPGGAEAGVYRPAAPDVVQRGSYHPAGAGGRTVS